MKPLGRLFAPCIGLCLFIAPEIEAANKALAPEAATITRIEPYSPPTVGTPSGYRGFQGSYNFPSGQPTPPKDGFPWTTC